jgi:hypothetical protein
MANWFHESEPAASDCTKEAAQRVAEDLDNNHVLSATAKLHECAFEQDLQNYEQNRVFLGQVKEHEKTGVGADLILKGGKQIIPTAHSGIKYVDTWTFEID